MTQRKKGTPKNRDTSKRLPPAKAGISRRDMLKCLGLGFLISRAGTLSSLEEDWETLCKLVRSVDEGRRNLLDRVGLSSERRAILTRLFGDGQRFLLRPGDDQLLGVHLAAPYGGRKAYPHEQQAMNAFATLFPDAVTVESGEFLEAEIKLLDSLVCAGSPVSNAFTRQYLPSCLQADMERPFKTVLDPMYIPYHFLGGPTEGGILVYSGMLGGTVAKKRFNGILVNTDPNRPEIWRPNHYVDSKNFLATDYLLISRLPRSPVGGQVLLVSGGHGPGTQAFELLFDEEAFPIDQLRQLETALGGASYYQFVLEVQEIQHEPPMSVARSLALSKELKPQVIPFHAHFFTSSTAQNERDQGLADDAKNKC